MMSTQFGGAADHDAIGRETGGHYGASQCQADDLLRLVERIADQLNDSDQRQTAAFAQMLARVESLGTEARHYKHKVPQEFLPAFERIEDGVSQLAERIFGSRGSPDDLWDHGFESLPHDDRHQPGNGARSFMRSADRVCDPNAPEIIQPSALQTTESVQALTPAHAIEPVMANDEIAWDQQAADALVDHYENEFGAIATDTDSDDPRDDESSDDRRGHGHGEMLAAIDAPQHRQADSASPRHVRASLLDSERDWLEEHFVHIARKVEETLAQRSPDPTLTGLDERFEQLEQRFGAAMHDIATRSDVETLHILETQISELAQQFEGTRGQLSRLDGIEHSLAAIIDRLTDPLFNSALERSGSEAPNIESLISVAVEQIAQRLDETQPSMPDLHGFAEGIADATAERVASRFADIAPSQGNGADADFGAIRQLLDQFINERREGEEQTAAVLDTVQRALIRVLDRVDALETSSAKTAAEYARYSSEPVGTQPLDNAAPAKGPAAGPAYYTQASALAQTPAPASRAPHGEAATRPFVEPAAATAASHQPQQPQRQPSSPASIERLRQDFIADARRAKDKAASAAPVSPSPEPRTAAPRTPVSEPVAGGVKLGKPRKEPATGEDDAGIVSRLRRPSRKLLVSAIVLMIAIPGVLMLLKKSQTTARAPAAIERSQATGERTIAPVSPTKQTSEGASGTAAPSSQVQKSPFTGTENQGITGGGASSQPQKLPSTERAPLGGQAAPESKDDLFRGHPKTQSRDFDQGTEAPAPVDGQRGSRLPSGPHANGGPPAGITVASPRNAPSLAQLERLNERNAIAQISSQLGEAQVDAVPAALIPEFMRGEATSEAAPSAPKAQASVSGLHRQPLDLPPAQVGPLSLRMAAASGNPSAEFAVAARFADGTGVKQDLAEAMRWYQRSASRGFSQSQYRVATLYERGLGVTQDNARAKIWYQRAAESGNVKAMHNLAVLSAGRTAKVPDYKAAAQWFNAAAEHGLADSQFNLAVLHESGLGVAQDAQAAYFWFALAGRNGDAEAVRRQNELEKSMTPAALADAKRKLDNWRPKQADRVANDPLAASEAWKTQAAADGAI